MIVKVWDSMIVIDGKEYTVEQVRELLQQLQDALSVFGTTFGAEFQ